MRCSRATALFSLPTPADVTLKMFADLAGHPYILALEYGDFVNLVLTLVLWGV